MTARTGNSRNLTPWPKGVSGNLTGRPKKVQTIAQLAEDASEAALKKLIKLIDSDKDQVALAAAQAVLDRSMGKPKQAVDVNSSRKNAHDYDESELYALAGLGGPRDHSPGAREEEPDRLQ